MDLQLPETTHLPLLQVTLAVPEYAGFVFVIVPPFPDEAGQ